MQFSPDDNLTPFDRQVELRVWMVRNGKVTFPEIGQWLGGISGSGAQKALDKDHISTSHHSVLLERGIPKNLLPAPLDMRPGPKVKPTPEEFLPQASKFKGGAHVAGR